LSFYSFFFLNNGLNRTIIVMLLGLILCWWCITHFVSQRYKILVVAFRGFYWNSRASNSLFHHKQNLSSWIKIYNYLNVLKEPSWSWSYASWIYNYLCEFESLSCEVYSIQQCVIKFVSDLRQTSGFLRVLRFSPPIKLTATIILKYCWKWC
jgi:hypothetical protein